MRRLQDIHGFAKAGSMPRHAAPEVFLDAPIEVGAEVLRNCARNCCSCTRSLIHSPDAVTFARRKRSRLTHDGHQVAMASRPGSRLKAVQVPLPVEALQIVVKSERVDGRLMNA